MRAANEYQQNATNKRGIVVDRDPAKMRVKVQFGDEDGTVSYWIDVLAKSSTGSSAFQMPGEGDEVWCAMDAKGEAGCLIGSRYNSKDATPFSGNDDIGMVFAGGSVHLDQASGNLTVSFSGIVRITASRIILEGDIDLGGEGGALIHRKGDVDSAGDVATGAASKVRAV